MNFFLIMAIFLGPMHITSYRSVPQQTKPSGYHWTASGERTHVRGCAVSRDLLKKNGGPLQYGDLIYVEEIGYRFVTDTMHERHKQAIDIWVATLQDEKKFDEKFRGKKLRAWVIRPLFKER